MATPTPSATDREVKSTTAATTNRIVLVTGANQGIGLEAVKQLAAHSDLTVLLGARDPTKANEAVALVGKPNVKPFIIDLNDDKSIAAAAETIKSQYGGLDVLVNNAGFAWKPASQFDAEVVAATYRTNYYGTLKLSNALWPLLRENGRVVNVSSVLSRVTLSKIAPVHQAKFTKRDLTVDQLTASLEEFATAVANNTWKADGWHDTAYGMSKVGVSALTEIQARENKTKGLLVNSCCPGWTITNMSGGKGNKTPAQGAEVLVHLALLPAGSPTGGFWENNVQTSWTTSPPAPAASS